MREKPHLLHLGHNIRDLDCLFDGRDQNLLASSGIPAGAKNLHREREDPACTPVPSKWGCLASPPLSGRPKGPSASRHHVGLYARDPMKVAST